MRIIALLLLFLMLMPGSSPLTAQQPGRLAADEPVAQVVQREAPPPIPTTAPQPLSVQPEEPASTQQAAATESTQIFDQAFWRHIAATVIASVLTALILRAIL